MALFNPYYQNFSPYPQYQQQQQNSFIHVQSEEQARAWNVSLGSSVTFIDDNQPYCYTKSMGMSQLEPPIFKKFKLVEITENAQEQASIPQNIERRDYVERSEYEQLCAKYEAIREDLEKIRKDLYENESSSSKTA